ncbi:bifunctional phosphopantothenoylcysteine decarboxylase/phosphopantothenate--cysteine ligase CoaBC [Ruicaihuangia caeni]|uniref:Coenzyme A biosynthesis bifunctional protein CoaBC n=1 Tax=Ruicaihuangia caeni TaxID=3042517 RepID=A0AAW6T2T2_9MICO|nr:bifunctional phosphopantothenoylcysteine decarboxylase/phosphopantothenate--cysteine ligase CoaBC [Klugiella sp. YN-L-19]MDI2098077.1 bifunctional phosphopantothenoylcysteine decarboxylase/phosphopantothenate--cysteine ligase CoaBC [Klugiella sp. YN-L-19]
MTSSTDRRALRVVVGITGGIAAYKAVQVVRSLVLAGHDVHVVPTASALEFIGLPTLEAISRNPVTADLYEGVDEVRHVALGQRADLIVIAPATANSIAKLANGLADDLLGNTVLASTAPLVIAPAMHTEMWQHPATQKNIAALIERGAVIVGPASGRLTGADTGPGRMSEPDEIVAAALAAVEQGDLHGRRIVVTAGGTREPLDPVRYLGNRSSGRQGVAIARAAARRGATVTLIAANLETAAPSEVELVPVSTAAELREAAVALAAEADVVIMAAAVADYRPAAISEGKIKKDEQGDELSLRLVRNPDILKELAEKRAEGRLVVGFAAETEPDRDALLALARKKLDAKGCDFLVVNVVGWDRGFASHDNEIIVLDRGGDIVAEASGSKMSVADRILDAIG